MKTQTKKQDRRINKTVNSLRDALVQLILEKHYDLITVQDIIDRANVGRSTFYLHFRDKEDLLFGYWQVFLIFFLQNFNWDNLREGRFVPIRELFFHLKDYHDFYRALVKSQKSERLFREGCRLLAENIEKEIEARFDESEINIPQAISADYLAREIFGQLRWWLDNNMPFTPEKMDEIFHELVMKGFRQTFTKT